MHIGQQFLTVFVKVMGYKMEHSFLRNDLDGKQLHIESKKEIFLLVNLL